MERPRARGAGVILFRNLNDATLFSNIPATPRSRISSQAGRNSRSRSSLCSFSSSSLPPLLSSSSSVFRKIDCRSRSGNRTLRSVPGMQHLAIHLFRDDRIAGARDIRSCVISDAPVDNLVIPASLKAAAENVVDRIYPSLQYAQPLCTHVQRVTLAFLHASRAHITAVIDASATANILSLSLREASRRNRLARPTRAIRT